MLIMIFYGSEYWRICLQIKIKNKDMQFYTKMLIITWMELASNEEENSNKKNTYIQNQEDI